MHMSDHVSAMHIAGLPDCTSSRQHQHTVEEDGHSPAPMVASALTSNSGWACGHGSVVQSTPVTPKYHI